MSKNQISSVPILEDGNLRAHVTIKDIHYFLLIKRKLPETIGTFLNQVNYERSLKSHTSSVLEKSDTLFAALEKILTLRNHHAWVRNEDDVLFRAVSVTDIFRTLCENTKRDGAKTVDSVDAESL